MAPGFLTGLEMDKGDRVLTFFNGMVARERLVTLDDEGCRLVYAVIGGQASHYNAAVQVFPRRRRQPDRLDGRPVARQTSAPAIGAMMDQAALAMKKTLAA